MKAWSAGSIATRAGDNDAAIAHFTHAIDLYGKGRPAALMTYRSRAGVFAKMNRHAEAVADYDRILTIDPARTVTYGLRATLLNELGRSDEALKGLDRALKYVSDADPILLARAGILSDAGRYDDAMADYDKALKIARGRFKTAIWVSETLLSFTAGKESPSRNKLKNDLKTLVARRDVRVVKALMQRGDMSFAFGETDKALADYTEVLKWSPAFGMGYRSRGWLYEQQGRPGLAYAEYRKASRLARTLDEWLRRALERTKPPRQGAGLSGS